MPDRLKIAEYVRATLSHFTGGTIDVVDISGTLELKKPPPELR